MFILVSVHIHLYISTSVGCICSRRCIVL